MKSLLKKFSASLVALTLVFAMFAGMTASALPTEDTINAFGQEWEILEDEIYGAYESLSECVEDYEPEDCEEIDMGDGTGFEFLPTKSKEYHHLTSEDKEILDAVIRRFGRASKKRIVETMHQEDAYTETEMYEIIRFKYVKTLSLS